jgi:Fe-S cluster biogenesis protein NfuA
VNWILKAKAFRLMDSVPFGGAFHPLFQRLITGRYYRRLEPLDKVAAPYLRHLDAGSRHGLDPARSVYLEFGGGCQGCGMVSVTLKYGVERTIRDEVPEVGDILDTTDHAAGRNPYYAPSSK